MLAYKGQGCYQDGGIVECTSEALDIFGHIRGKVLVQIRCHVL
jgi:hypothetical protein